MKLDLSDFAWKPIHTAPLNGQFVEMKGPSGYIGVNSRIIVARYEADRADENDPGLPFDKSAWRSHCGDHLTDDGEFPTHWRILTTEFEPSDPLAPERRQGDRRKAHYGDGIQPWDVILANGWGPQFAASNVLKYLRRTKNPAHSAESAVWYYARLVEGAAEGLGPNPREEWQAVLDRLELSLTTEETKKARGG